MATYHLDRRAHSSLGGISTSLSMSANMQKENTYLVTHTRHKTRRHDKSADRLQETTGADTALDRSLAPGQARGVVIT